MFKTPLRYPGGKQRLTPFVHQILEKNGLLGGHYVEPYAGGAGVAIELLLSDRVGHIHLNDSDFGIYAFWYSVLNYTEEFCNLIRCASLTVDEWRLRREIVKNKEKNNILELGFSVFFLNRCNRSGVLSGGVIGGLNQKGNYKMDARFSRNELIRRIETISLFKERITLTNMDAKAYIQNYLSNLPEKTLVYLDPPYYEQGSHLYLNFYKKKDHSDLSKIIQSEINHNWILSYDGVEDILNLYLNRRHFLYDLQYSAATSYKGKEVFIFSDGLNIPSSSPLVNIDLGLKSILCA